MGSTEFKFRSHPADFEILYSAIRNFTLEMGITMERTSRAPIYFAAHDFSYRWDFLLIFALISTPILSFQTVTTKMKLKWLKRNKEIASEVSIDIA